MKLKNFLSLMVLGSVTLASAQGAYDYSRLQRESLGRGVVAVRENPSTVMVSWRYLSSDLGVDPNGREYFYNANDASIGDVDGDGFKSAEEWFSFMRKHAGSAQSSGRGPM